MHDSGLHRIDGGRSCDVQFKGHVSNCTSSSTKSTLNYYLNFNSFHRRDDNELALAYFPTHNRYASWLIGVFCGYFIFQARKRPVHMSKVKSLNCRFKVMPNFILFSFHFIPFQLFNLCAWTLSLVAMLSAILANYPLCQPESNIAPLYYGLYDGLSRVAWSFALCYIIFACVNGYGGPFNWFLSHPLWQPLSKLSYSIYLLHFPVIMVTLATTEAPAFLSQFNVVCVLAACFYVFNLINRLFICSSSLILEFT